MAFLKSLLYGSMCINYLISQTNITWTHHMSHPGINQCSKPEPPYYDSVNKYCSINEHYCHQISYLSCRLYLIKLKLKNNSPCCPVQINKGIMFDGN